MPLAGGPIAILARGLNRPASLEVAPGGDIFSIAGDTSAAVYDRATDNAVSRIVQSGNDIDYTTGLCADADRLFTVSNNGVFVMQR